MACSCIKNFFDVNIEFTDCSTLVINDMSEWMRGDEYSLPISYTVDLTLKSWDKTTTVTIKANSSNVFTSKDLFGLDCFGDDILCLTTESCGVKYTKSKALICESECKVKGLLANAKTESDFEIANGLLLIAKSIKFNVDFDRLSVAEQLLETLKSKLKKMDCGKIHCGCK